MRDMKKDLLDAIELCKTQRMCDLCPMREEICDSLIVEMIKLPERLVDKIEKELAEEMTI